MHATYPTPPKLLKQFSAPSTAANSYFLTFEGIEGAGKTTQIERVKQYLESKYKITVTILREPGGTAFGEKLRSAILKSEVQLHPLAEAHLFASSRAQLLEEITIKKLQLPDQVIIYDRYIDSSIAYQGVARDLGINTILEIHQHYPLNQMPNLTFLLDISLETSMERQKKRNSKKDYFEAETREFYQQLINGYNKTHELFPKRVKKIDAQREEMEIFEDIKTAIDQLIGASKKTS